MKIEKSTRGFTLIELLVVIAIIGLLSSLSVIALNSARAKSRDAKRISDVKQLQTALELYFNDYNLYPTTAAVASGASLGGVNTYMSLVPTAPTPPDSTCTTAQNTYTYGQDSSGSSYHISYCLGSLTGSIAAGAHDVTPVGLVNP